MSEVEISSIILNSEKSYVKFIEDIYQTSPNSEVVFDNDLYFYLVSLFSCIVNSIDCELHEGKNSKVTFSNIESQNNQIDKFLNDIWKSNSTISIFTSGTTGAPKKVNHSVSWFCKNSFVGEKYLESKWGLSYNPTHMAGLQVVFQAILNLNPISFWFKKSRDLIFEDIERYKITNISGTPTFFKLIQPYDKIFPNVKRVTLGGERASNLLINNLKSSFPNAKFNNIYATTEFGSLLISRGDIFEIPINKSNYIRIFDNQLQVFSKCENNESKWINTGDLVELVNNNPMMFIFAARNINFVNIGGERINIEEIEDLINTLSYVKFCRVFERSTSIMNVLCVDIVLHDLIQKTNVEINSDFRALGLLNGRCPQIIKLVESIGVTRTGKIKR